MNEPLDKAAFWKAKRREHKQMKKLLRKKQVEEILARGGDPSVELKPLRKKKRQLADIVFSPIQVAIDLQFDSQMTEKEVKLLVNQIYHVYGSNNNAEHPLKLTLTSFNGPTSKGVENIGGFNNWVTLQTSLDPLDVHFDPQRIVYLTAESETVLHELDEHDVYIIGGLVDHNRLKGVCHELAKEKGIRTARLPLSEYVDMKTRKVLTVNQVFDIILQKTIQHDWQVVLDKIIPKRKGAKPKTQLQNEFEFLSVEESQKLNSHEKSS